MPEKQLPFVVAGGGIGGLAVALTLARQGHHVQLFEQARQFSEIGAGLQLGPNAIRLLRKWGVLADLQPHLIAPDELRMMDGLSGKPVGIIPLGATFVERFQAPYYVAYRTDLHRALLSACRARPNIRLEEGQAVSGFEQDGDGVVTHTRQGRSERARALIGADGLRSTLRQLIVGDGDPTFANHTCYRTLLKPDEMPQDSAWHAATLWAGRGTHLVHYPIAGGSLYNIVATVTSDWRHDGWNEPGDKAELLHHFRHNCAQSRRILDAGQSYRKWALADRAPVTGWSKGRVTLLGDAAHPVLQYYAQGAAMALEDADCLAELIARHGDNIQTAFALYEQERQPRTARLYHEARKLGELYHATGIKRLLRNLIMPRTPPDKWYEKVSWIYAGPAAQHIPHA
mgnify:CR=1 FL=1